MNKTKLFFVLVWGIWAFVGGSALSLLLIDPSLLTGMIFVLEIGLTLLIIRGTWKEVFPINKPQEVIQHEQTPPNFE